MSRIPVKKLTRTTEHEGPFLRYYYHFEGVEIDPMQNWQMKRVLDSFHCSEDFTAWGRSDRKDLLEDLYDSQFSHVENI